MKHKITSILAPISFSSSWIDDEGKGGQRGKTSNHTRGTLAERDNANNACQRQARNQVRDPVEIIPVLSNKATSIYAPNLTKSSTSLEQLENPMVVNPTLSTCDVM